MSSSLSYPCCSRSGLWAFAAVQWKLYIPWYTAQSESFRQAKSLEHVPPVGATFAELRLLVDCTSVYCNTAVFISAPVQCIPWLSMVLFIIMIDDSVKSQSDRRVLLIRAIVSKQFTGAPKQPGEREGGGKREKEREGESR